MGAQEVLGVQLEGKGTPALVASGQLGWGGERLVGKAEALLAEGSLAVTITTKLLLVKHEKEWTFELWDEVKIWESEPWVISDHAKGREQLKQG